MRTPLRLFLVSLFSLSAFIINAPAQQKPELYLQTAHTGGVYRIAFGLDDRALITGGGENTVKVWDLLTGRDVRTLQAQEMDRSALSADGKLLASLDDLSETKTIHLMETETGRELRRIESAHGEIDSLALSPNGELLAAIHRSYEREESSQVILWRVSDGTELRAFAVKDDYLIAISFSPDSSRLLVKGYSASGPPAMKTTFWAAMWDIASGQKLYRVMESSSPVLSPDGATLAGLEGNTLKLWRAADGALLHVVKDPSGGAVASRHLHYRGRRRERRGARRSAIGRHASKY